MADADGGRMDALTQANVNLLRRVASLERRVADLERQLGSRAAAEADAPAAAVAEPLVVEAPAPRAAVESTAQPVARAPRAVVEPAPEPRQPAVETRIGLTWVNRVAVFTLILAVAFLFKYAVDNEWIGPGARVMVGALAGLAAIGSAEALWRRGHQVYAQGVTGLGVAILYLSIYAGFSFYQLLPQRASFALMALVTASTVAMAVRYGARAIAVLGLLGGFATPVLLSTGEPHTWFVLSYTLVLDMAALGLARRFGWRSLEWLALAGTAVLYGGTLETALRDNEHFAAGLFALLYWALFAAMSQRMAFYLAHFFTSVLMYQVLEDRPGGYGVITVLLAAAMLALGDRRGWRGALTAALAAFAVSWLIWDDAGQRGLRGVTLCAGFAMFLAWTPWRVLAGQAAVTLPELLAIVANAALAASGLYMVLEGDGERWRGLAAATLAAAHLGVAWRLRAAYDARVPALLAGVAVALLTVAIPMQFEAYRVTMAWALEGAAAVWIAARHRQPLLGAAGLLILWIALVRLFAVDASMYARSEAIATLMNARFATFAVAAAALFLASRWREGGVLAAIAYGTGHFVLIWGLGLEVLGWAARTASPENVRNVESAGISILIAAYAVALAALGIATRTALNRVFGLSLIGLVVAKLYLYDVWDLRLLYRVLAFGVLGVLLLGLSFLYSRTRVKRG